MECITYFNKGEVVAKSGLPQREVVVITRELLSKGSAATRRSSEGQLRQEQTGKIATAP